MTSKREGERSSGGLQHIWAILYYLFGGSQLTTYNALVPCSHAPS